MRFVSQFLKHFAYPALHHYGILKRIAPISGCAVVNYHGVFPASYESLDPLLDGNLVSRVQLQEQLRFLKANYAVLTPDDFRSWIQTGSGLPSRAVLVTCDDGLLNHLDDMLPILRNEGIACLFFATGGSCSPTGGELWYEEMYRLMKSNPDAQQELRSAFCNGQPHDPGKSLQEVWWETALHASRIDRNMRAAKIAEARARFPLTTPPGAEGRWRFLDPCQLRLLVKAGMTIGAHTVSHPILSECGLEASYVEIQESKESLERVLGQTIWAFAYPFGNPATMGSREVEFARKAGFECAFLNVDGGFSGRSAQFAFPRTHITATMSVAELEAHMTGLHARLQKAIRG